MTSTLDGSSNTTAINFADRVHRRRGGVDFDYDEDHYSIWSCKFSADGNEVIAGGSSMIFGTRACSKQRNNISSNMIIVYDLLSA